MLNDYIYRIKEGIEKIIHICSIRTNDPEITNYVAGLADALEIINYEEQFLHKVGKRYFVLVWNENSMTTDIENRELSKITLTPSRTTYTFSKDRNDIHPIVLHGKGGLASRIFETYEDAERGRNHVYLDKKRQY